MTNHPYATEIRSLLRTLNRHKFTPFRVFDGVEDVTTKNQKEAVEAILSVDDSCLKVNHPNGNVYSLYIVLGNDPGEAVCNHSDFDPLTVAMTEHYDRWSE